jgi:hypothetical protein
MHVPAACMHVVDAVLPLDVDDAKLMRGCFNDACEN